MPLSVQAGIAICCLGPLPEIFAARGLLRLALVARPPLYGAADAVATEPLTGLGPR